MVKTKQYVVARVKPVLSTLDDTGSKFTIRIILKAWEKKWGPLLFTLRRVYFFCCCPEWLSLLVPAWHFPVTSWQEAASGLFSPADGQRLLVEGLRSISPQHCSSPHCLRGTTPTPGFQREISLLFINCWQLKLSGLLYGRLFLMVSEQNPVLYSLISFPSTYSFSVIPIPTCVKHKLHFRNYHRII